MTGRGGQGEEDRERRTGRGGQGEEDRERKTGRRTGRGRQEGGQGEEDRERKTGRRTGRGGQGEEDREEDRERRRGRGQGEENRRGQLYHNNNSHPHFLQVLYYAIQIHFSILVCQHWSNLPPSVKSLKMQANQSYFKHF